MAAMQHQEWELPLNREEEEEEEDRGFPGTPNAYEEPTLLLRPSTFRRRPKAPQMQLEAQRPCLPIPIPIPQPKNQPYSKPKKEVRHHSRADKARKASQMDDVMHLCSELLAHDQIKVAVRSSTKGAMLAGGVAFVGGLLGGPVGIALGGVIGSLLGSWLTRGKFRPLPQILMELSPTQKEKLYKHAVAVLGHLDWTDAAQLIALVMGNATLQQQVTAALRQHIIKEFRAKVRYQD